jgi:predicted AAA+ superfamily ATPase
MTDGNFIARDAAPLLRKAISPGKVAVVYGPRRTGKTTLVTRLAGSFGAGALLVSAEDIAVRDYLASESVEKLRAFVGAKTLLVIDEAQHIPNIGLNLKLLADHMPGLSVVATGSSSFDLARQTGQPLAGRQRTITLLPISQRELSATENAHETAARLEQRLVHGSYPEVITAAGDAARAAYLRELAGAHLLRDILEMEGVRRSEKLLRLLQLLAFQIGHDVSIDSLGQELGISKNTAARYLDLLEKAFIIYSHGGFSRNLRKEISKSRRYYFFDNGVRNAVISNFSPIALRDDKGALWENHVCSERIKRNLALDIFPQSYFWRTHDQQEIDLIEDLDGRLGAYEIKSGQAKAPQPKAWAAAYPGAVFKTINRDNYIEFVTK